MKSIRLLPVLFILLTACAQDCQKEMSVTFTVSVNDLTDKYIDIRMDCHDIQTDELVLRLPVWAPGYYLILDYPKNIHDFSVTAADGSTLEWQKAEKNGWKIDTKGHCDITVSYRVWADEQSVAEASVSEDHLFLPGNGVFMHSEGGIGLSSDIKFVRRPEWSSLVTGLKRIDNEGIVTYSTDACADTMRYQAENFDVLYDSPFFWGNPDIRSFEYGGHHYDVSFQGESGLDLDSLCNDIRKIISAATELMGDVPYDKYAFMFLGPGQGGLEHCNSQADFLAGIRLEDYTSTISFIAHEYFHLYNVKAIHPVELGPFNYGGECYTNCLWLSEGATVFYEYALLERAGLISAQQRLDCMASDFKVFESRDGKNHMTLARSSYDIWLNFFNFAGNGGDTRISYYEKGPAVTLLFDCAIRIISGGERSFDDVMRLLYERYYMTLQRGFTEDELNALIAEVAAPSKAAEQALLDEVFSYIYTLKPLDYNRFLEPCGMHWDASDYSLSMIN